MLEILLTILPETLNSKIAVVVEVIFRFVFATIQFYLIAEMVIFFTLFILVCALLGYTIPESLAQLTSTMEQNTQNIKNSKRVK